MILIMHTYTYNSNGFATKIKAALNSSSYVFSLEGGEEAEIPFRIYFVIPSIISIVIISIFNKKRLKIIK